jgi:hypothetical protein
MHGALATTMVNAVGLALGFLGVVGAVLAGWQVVGFTIAGGVPAVAEIWRHSGLTGDIIVTFFAWLPQLLAAAILWHLVVAALGAGLIGRRRWAWSGGLAFAVLWTACTAGAWLLSVVALEDLARGYPERASFAHAVEPLAAWVALGNVAVVRAQFRADR